MLVLGIETSCDETGVALYSTKNGLLSHAIKSHIAINAPYQGIVPELCSREHIRTLLPLIRSVMKKAQVDHPSIDGLAYTAGPGLIGALLVWASLVNTLGMAWNKPVIGVHHLEGHLLAPLLEPITPPFPFVALLVSGGHTMLIQVKDYGQYKILGETLDDAAGEAFDKTARLLDLPYPGGPYLAKLSEKGDPTRFPLPRPMLRKDQGLVFSFSGLKTAVRELVEKEGPALSPQTKADIAASFQEAIVETLVKKSLWALELTQIPTLVISGGVGANKRLRTLAKSLCEAKGYQAFYPAPHLCTDNGAMIAFAGAYRLANKMPSLYPSRSCVISVNPRWSLSDVNN